MKTSLRLSIVAAAGLLCFAQIASAQTSTSGAVRGNIKDKATGKPVAGATVVATSPSLQGTQAQITDSSGAYVIPNLPPGTYELTVYYADAKFTRTNVLVQLGKTAVVNVGINSKAGKGEVITIKGEAPVIDEGSSKTGVTINSNYTQNIPTGHTFAGVLGAAAGSQGDLYGVSIGGSTSVENEYIVNGIDTTGTAFGLQQTNLPNEFVQETEVITGGYNAEYGRSTGGIVNVITKSGSNHFHGSVFARFTPGTLVASAKQVPSAGNAIVEQDHLSYDADVGGEIGGPIIKDKLWFHVGFNPTFSHTNVDRNIVTQVDKNNDGVPDVDPSTGFPILQKVNGATHHYYDNGQTYYYTGKLTGAVNQNNQGQLTITGNPSTSRNYGGGLAGVGIGNGVNGTQSSGLWLGNDSVYDVAGKWTSKFNNNATQVDVVAGYHVDNSNATPGVPAGGHGIVRFNPSAPLIAYKDFEKQLDGGAFPQACLSPGDPGYNASADKYKKLTDANRCPVTFYTVGGLGFLASHQTNRLVAKASITQRVKALGHHTFKAGADIQDQHYNLGEQYTGEGFTEQLNAQDPTSATGGHLWELVHFYQPKNNLNVPMGAGPGSPNIYCGATITGRNGMNNGDATCQLQNVLHADAHMQNLSAYVQDSWSILPNLTIDAGVRWEQQNVYTANQVQGVISPTTGKPIPKLAFSLKNNFAPRIGIIYDPTQEGRAKIFAHWGRFYESVPMDMQARDFGGEATHINVLSAASCNSDPTMAVGSNGKAACNEQSFDPSTGVGTLQSITYGGGQTEVAPGLGAQYMDEWVAGGEYEILPDFKIGATYQHRQLGRIIEDMSGDQGVTYILANPGQIDQAGINQIKAQAAAAMKAGQMGEAAFLNNLADNYTAVGGFDKPVRNYDALVLTAEKRFTHHFMLKASYTYSVLKGNYPGLFSADTGQLDPNITSEYDLPQLLANRYGNLNADRPNNFKLDGYYQKGLKKIGVFTLGGSVRVASGIPVQYLGGDLLYGLGESFVLPRGAGGRTPLTHAVDAHLAYGHRLGKGMLLQAFVDVFNIFNTQITTSVDNEYTFDNVHPIVGGDKADLAHAKALDPNGLPTNTIISKNPNYDNATSYEAPREVRLGLRLTF